MIISVDLDENDWERVCDILSNAAEVADELMDDEEDEHVASELAHDALNAARLFHYITVSVGITLQKHRDIRYRGPSAN